MKLFLSVDMEGISGLVRWDDVASRGIDFERNRLLMTLDTNAAIEGALEGGVTEVVVEENHGVEDLCVLLLEEIDPRCTVVRGAGRPGATTMAALDASIDLVFLVGHHAAVGAFPGIMAHTISYQRFRSVRVNSVTVGEPDLFAIRAGELGAPVALVTGDQIVGAELRKRVPSVEIVEVKQALARQSGRVIPPVRARELIRAGARRAAERAAAGEIEPYLGERAPYEIEVELTEDIDATMRANLDSLPEFEIAAPRTVVTSAPDMDLGFRRIAYLGFASLPNVRRY
jgi:D-amino peptidase